MIHQLSRSQSYRLHQQLDKWVGLQRHHTQTQVLQHCIINFQMQSFACVDSPYRADLVDFDSLEPENIVDNLNNAFDVAEKELGIPKLLDTEGLLLLL